MELEKTVRGIATSTNMDATDIATFERRFEAALRKCGCEVRYLTYVGRTIVEAYKVTRGNEVVNIVVRKNEKGLFPFRFTVTVVK